MNATDCPITSLRTRFRRMYLLAFLYGTIFGLEIAAVIYLLLKP